MGSAMPPRYAVVIPPVVILVIVFQLILRIGCALGAPCARMERVAVKTNLNSLWVTCVEVFNAMLPRYAAAIQRVAILVSVCHPILKIGCVLGAPDAQMERVVVKTNL